MKRIRALLPSLILALLSLVLAGALPFPPDSPIVSEAEIFPVEPAVNDQRGFAVAMDGEWLALGARLEDVDGKKNAGAVHLFHLEEGTWKHKARLTSPDSQNNGQFGLAVSLRGDTLAVGAPGRSAIYVFVRQGSQWNLQMMTASGGTDFGCSLSVDGDWLAVSEGDPHGELAGSVHLYRRTNGIWTQMATLDGASGERFGHSVSLRDDTLVVGAPGADGAKGAAYVYTRIDAAWSLTAPLKDPDAAEGDQFGFAVATNGQEVVVGEPTAGLHNLGAAWVWHPGNGLTRLSGGSGGQLGYAVAIDGDRIVAGAPFGGSQLFGSVSIFDRVEGSWSVQMRFEAESADVRDLSGFSVAVSGEWVILGSALADQGGHAAGSVSSIRCQPEMACLSWNELAVQPGEQETFGISVAADGDTFAVGARGEGDPERGSVTVFRRARAGWRQETRLISMAAQSDELGYAVALAGDLLVVGDPSGNASFIDTEPEPEPAAGGAVYLFRRKNGVWEPETRLSAPGPAPNDFGRSVATDGESVVVGAGGTTGAAYVFELQPDVGWSGVPLVSGADLPVGAAFGSAVAVRGNTIVVGAPLAAGHKGELHVFLREMDGTWKWQTNLASGSLDKAELGSSVSLSVYPDPVDSSQEKKVLVAGAPHQNTLSSGDAYLFESSDGSYWASQILPHELRDKQAFGSAVAVRGTNVVIGAPVLGPPVGVDSDQAFLFQRGEDEQWNGVAVDAIPRVRVGNGERAPVGDSFGTAVAIGKDFFVVTSPGKNGGDRVAVFELPKEVMP